MSCAECVLNEVLAELASGLPSLLLTRTTTFLEDSVFDNASTIATCTCTDFRGYVRIII